MPVILDMPKLPEPVFLLDLPVLTFDLLKLELESKFDLLVLLCPELLAVLILAKASHARGFT